MVNMEAKNELLHEAFKNMNYGENIEDTTDGENWLVSSEVSDQFHTVEELLKNLKTTTKKAERHHFVELAKELKAKSGVIAQIEVLKRGVLSKDTHKSINILIQYLNYYSSFVKIKDDHATVKGTHVVVLDDNSPLWILGLVIAPSLAAKNRIILQTGLKFAAVLKFILEIAKRIGISEDLLVLVPSVEIELQPYLSSEQVSFVTLFLDLLNPNCRGINKYHKKLLVLSSYKSCSIIFDDADLDSSVDCIISAAWGHQGTLPWSIDTIIVQENIFKKVSDKLKQRLLKIKVGHGDDKNADMSYPNDCNLNDHVKKARSLGIEVYQPQTTKEDTFQPTLIIGSKVSTNNVIEAPENTGALTLIPFRFIDEAVNLANNSRQGLGISVWAEKIGLVNEVARKLKVNNVWVNCHGLFSPEIPLTPYKDSGVGCFSSDLGYWEYTNNIVGKFNPSYMTECSFSSKEIIKNAFKSAKIAIDSWWSKSFLEKRHLFKQLQTNINLEELEETLEEGINAVPHFGTYTINGYNVSSLKEPRGVIVIEMMKTTYNRGFKVLISALLEGNAIIILNDVPELGKVFDVFNKQLPKGILSVFPYSMDAAGTCAVDRRINGYFSTIPNIIFGTMPLADSKIFELIVDDWQDSFRKTVLIKNVWTNIGESFQCNI